MYIYTYLVEKCGLGPKPQRRFSKTLGGRRARIVDGRYGVTSLIRKCLLLGPYSGPTLRWS